MAEEEERRQLVGSDGRRKRDLLLALNPILIAIVGYFLLKMFALLDANTAAINAEALAIARLEITTSSNASQSDKIITELGHMREQQLDMAERLARVEAQSRSKD